MACAVAAVTEAQRRLCFPQTCYRCKARRRCTKKFTVQKFPKILVLRILSPPPRARARLLLLVATVTLVATDTRSLTLWPPRADLKRFSEARRTSKLSTFVNFPMKDLDLREFSSESSGEASPPRTPVPAHLLRPHASFFFSPRALVAANAVYHLYAVSNHSGTTMGGHYTAYCRNPGSGEWYTFNDSRWVPAAHLPAPLPREPQLWGGPAAMRGGVWLASRSSHQPPPVVLSLLPLQSNANVLQPSAQQRRLRLVLRAGRRLLTDVKPPGGQRASALP